MNKEFSNDSATEDLDRLCEQWVTWSRTRRLYGPSSKVSGTLSYLVKNKTRPLQHFEDQEIECQSMLALHLAYTCQPDALDRRVFELYYLYRIRPVKRAADIVGISRKHFYSVLSDFRRRLNIALKALIAADFPTSPGDAFIKKVAE